MSRRRKKRSHYRSISQRKASDFTRYTADRLDNDRFDSWNEVEDRFLRDPPLTVAEAAAFTKKRSVPRVVDPRLDRRVYHPVRDRDLVYGKGRLYDRSSIVEAIRQVEYEREVCKRRDERRSALFSRGRAGKGVAGPRFRLMRDDSKVKC